MRVLVACEFSGVVREAFKKAGHDAWSCDLLDTEIAGQHLIGEVENFLQDDWDMMIAFPPCTYIASSGLHWNKRRPERALLTQKGLAFVEMLLYCNIPKIALENPVGLISTKIRKPDQIVQPWMFGHAETKKTCLWLKNLPPLVPTKVVEPEYMLNEDGSVYKDKRGKRYNPLHFYTWRMPDDDRWRLRSRTYEGIATAMAEQWG